jgi:hypothetical protein
MKFTVDSPVSAQISAPALHQQSRAWQGKGGPSRAAGEYPASCAPVVVIYGQENENEALADELALDGFDTRLVSEPASVGEVDLIVFAVRRSVAQGSALYVSCEGVGLRVPVLVSCGSAPAATPRTRCARSRPELTM